MRMRGVTSARRMSCCTAAGRVSWLARRAAPVEAQTGGELLATCQDEAEAARRRASRPARASSSRSGDRREPRAEAFLQRGVLHGAGAARGKRRSGTTPRRSSSTAPTRLPYFNRGNAYDQLGQLDLAIADYTEAIKLDPTDPDFFNNRGQTYDSRGEHDLAIADYTEAIRLDATSARPLYNRGLSYANKGDYQRAIADFDAGHQAGARRHRSLRGARGGQRGARQRDAAARADYRKALEIDARQRGRAWKGSTASAARASSLLDRNATLTSRPSPELVEGLAALANAVARQAHHWIGQIRRLNLRSNCAADHWKSHSLRHRLAARIQKKQRPERGLRPLTLQIDGKRVASARSHYFFGGSLALALLPVHAGAATAGALALGVLALLGLRLAFALPSSALAFALTV